MNTLSAMSVFVAVAEQGGFAPAARILGMSPTAVSRHVQELERALGAQLLRRTTRRLSLTEAGERYLPTARRVLTEVRELHEEIASLNETPRGRLRVTATPGFGEYFLAPLAARFAAAYPELSLEMDFVERVVDLVAEGYDAGVRSGDLRDSTLRSKRLTEMRYVTCASPAYLERFGAPERPEDLTRHACVHWRWRSGAIVWRFIDGDEIISVPVTGRFIVSSYTAEREGALAGLGIALLPPFQIEEDARAGRLVKVLEAFEPVPERISIVWPAAATMPRKLRVFIDYMTEEITRSPLC